MIRQIHDPIGRLRLAFVLAVVLAGITVLFNRLPVLVLTLHLRNVLAGFIPFVIGLPFGLALLPARERNGLAFDLERGLFAVGLGQGLVCGLTFLLLTAHLAHMIAFPLLAAGVIIVSLRRWGTVLRAWRAKAHPTCPPHAPRPTPHSPLPTDLTSVRSVLLFLFCAAVLYLGCALLPPVNYDALEYHLAVPQAWLANHGWVPFPHNIYAWFPMNMELMYMWGLALGDSPATTVINLFFAVACAAAVWALARRPSTSSGRRGGGEHASWLAVIVLVSSGLMIRLVMQADIDLGVCFYSLLALVAFVRWSERAELHSLVLSAIFVGLALGCKYIAAISVWVPMLILVLAGGPAGKRLTGMIWMLFLPVCVVAPWLLRNAIMIGNPVFPLLYRWLGGEGWTAAADAFFRTAHAPKPLGLGGHLVGLIRSPVDLTILDLTVFSPLILAGGLVAVLVNRRDRLVRLLLLFSAVVFALWFILTQRNHRFLITVVPPLAVVAAWGLECEGSWLRRPIRWPIWVVSYTSLYFLLLGLSLNNGLSYLAGAEDVSGYYERVLPHMRAIRFLNDRHSNRPVRVLFVGEAQAYGCRFDAIVPVVFNPHPWLTHDRSGQVIPQTVEQAGRRLRELGVTHVLYNEAELTRLIRGYAPEGWPDGRELARLIHLMDGTWLRSVFETENGVVGVLEVNASGRAKETI